MEGDKVNRKDKVLMLRRKERYLNRYLHGKPIKFTPSIIRIHNSHEGKGKEINA